MSICTFYYYLTCFVPAFYSETLVLSPSISWVQQIESSPPAGGWLNQHSGRTLPAWCRHSMEFRGGWFSPGIYSRQTPCPGTRPPCSCWSGCHRWTSWGPHPPPSPRGRCGGRPPGRCTPGTCSCWAWSHYSTCTRSSSETGIPVKSGKLKEWVLYGICLANVVAADSNLLTAAPWVSLRTPRQTLYLRWFFFGSFLMECRIDAKYV